MLRNVIYGILIVFLLLVGSVELGYTFNKSYSVHLLVAGAATAFLFSMAGGFTTGSVMANGEKDDAATWEGFGQKARIPTKMLTGVNILVVGMFAVILFMQYRILESISEQTYVLSLSQPERERLNLTMPESLRKKIRAQ